MNFEEVMAQASQFHQKPNALYLQQLLVTITTNQRGQSGTPGSGVKKGMIASYAQGALQYVEGPRLPKHLYTKMVDRLETPPSANLSYLFDNRQGYWPDEPDASDTAEQPFDSHQADKIGFSIAGDPKNPKATFTLRSWGNASFDVELTPLGDILIGTGPAIGNAAGTQTAVYTIAFEVFYLRRPLPFP
ncbi:hypothetical protein [Nocardia sp. NPDC003726]